MKLILNSTSHSPLSVPSTSAALQEIYLKSLGKYSAELKAQFNTKPSAEVVKPKNLQLLLKAQILNNY
jgi:hypothetical protein